MKIDINYYFY